MRGKKAEEGEQGTGRERDNEYEKNERKECEVGGRRRNIGGGRARNMRSMREK